MNELIVFAAECDKTKELCNPLADKFDTIPGFLQGTLAIAMSIGVPFIGLILVYAGFKFLATRNNPEGIGKAWYNLRYVILGVVVFLGAWALTVLVDSTIKDIMNG